MSRPLIGGIDNKLYYSTGNLTVAGNFTTAGNGTSGNMSWGNMSWTEITIVGDVKHTDSRTKSALKIRGGGGFTFQQGGLRDLTLSWESPTIPGDPVYDALVAAQAANTQLTFAVLNGTPSANGTTGFVFEGTITKADYSEPVDGLDMTSFEADPCYPSGNSTNLNTPQRVKVGS